MKKIKRWQVLVLAACLVAAAIYAGWVVMEKRRSSKALGTPKAIPPISVIAELSRKADFRILISGIGTVIPLNTVVIKSRVDGQLIDVLFKEGQVVQKGDLLARIDPRPFEVQLRQAEGQMLRDRELLNNAKLDLERYRVLWKQDSISRQQLDTQEALVRQYEGTLKSDQASIDSAKLQLFYCRITAPISGRLGLRLIDPGNMVRATDAGGLVVMTQLQPITVIFSIPEDHLPAILTRFRSGNRMPVVAYDRELKQKIATGVLMTIDNQVDTATGTVRLKAIFANKDKELFPNQFVNARLLLDTRRGAIVIPSSAVQRGPRGSFVYVVKDDKTVELRPVSIDDIQGGEAAVKKGLLQDEMVVVDGTERLREGSAVEVRRSSRHTGAKTGQSATAQRKDSTSSEKQAAEAKGE